MATPFDKLEGFIWFDGKFVAWQEAKIHILTHGLHYASVVFEGQRAYNGKIFELEAHTQRLFDSAKALHMDIPYTMEEINNACKEALIRNKLTDAYMRPIVWRGSEKLGLGAKGCKLHTAIATWEWPAYFDQTKPIRLCLADYHRPHPNAAPCHAKASGLYVICTLSKHIAEEKGYDDALMLDAQGHIAEATGANIFFTKGDELHTPRPDSFLDGITRRTIIRLAKKRGYKVIERIIDLEELKQFEECFVTGTAAEVQAVGEVASGEIASGEIVSKTFKPAHITKTLTEDYKKLVRE